MALPKNRRILLINPSSEKLGWERFFQLPPLPLLQVAAATPDGWEVVLADEHAEKLPEADGFDLVGLTAMTRQAPRAYALADAFRERGTPVVMGGIHPTVLPDEALRHCDAVVVGEAEHVWPRLLDDFASGCGQRLYRAAEPEGDQLDVPRARRSILDGKRYLTRQTLQASRGCPYDCPFCTVTPYFGRRFRFRPVQDILEEVAAFPRDLVVFLDDNILGDRERAVPLLEGLEHLGKNWASQTTLRFAEDRALLDLVARSGCLGLYVGVEGISGEGSRLAKGRVASERADLVKRIRDAGIIVELSLIFGFDDQDESVFEETVRFVESCAPGAATFHLLTPYPGTAYFRTFESEGRLLHKDWGRYDTCEVVFKPRLMTPGRLYRGWAEARKAVHSWTSIFRRAAACPKHRLASFGYNVLRKGPNDRLDPGKMEAESQRDSETANQRIDDSTSRQAGP